jgi:hypothetical protein
MKSLGFLLLAMIGLLFLEVKPTADTSTKKQIVWTQEDSKAYAQDQLSKWQDKQWSCLSQLWGKESAWNSKAFNSVKVMGKNAGGIPQLLGLDPKTPATQQIDRGLDYIYYRYTTPCNAWAHFKKYGWH